MIDPMKTIAQSSGKCLEVLALLYPESSRSSIKQWIREGRLAVDGLSLKKWDGTIEKGAEVILGEKRKWADFEVRIIYEDRDLVVIEKPAGLLSVATAFEESETAHGALKRRYRKQQVFPVHRLDRETSGVMVFAYSPEARVGLKEQFKEHSITREYRAVLQGKMEETEGIWKSRLQEDDAYYVRSNRKGQLAVTHYKVLRKSKELTYLSLQLETGRKNQVRVHASEAGFPIVGDKKYGATINPFQRLGLHAYLLEFFHPVLKKKMVFKSPIPTKFNL